MRDGPVVCATERPGEREVDRRRGVLVGIASAARIDVPARGERRHEGAPTDPSRFDAIAVQRRTKAGSLPHMDPIGHLRSLLGTVTATTALPYGYTVTIWCSGATLIHERGDPLVGDVFLFLAGAITAFAAAATLAGEHPQPPTPKAHQRAGMLHLATVAAAVGAAALLANVDSWVAWPIASFTATAVYIVGAALELMLSQHLARTTDHADS
jgi:hypothetical protein